jgi:hypothetical protein
MMVDQVVLPRLTSDSETPRSDGLGDAHEHWRRGESFTPQEGSR